MKVSISSPAKINLHLKILDKNSDGYHNLDTSFQFIDLYDFMTFEQVKDGILIDINNSLLNAKENTIYKSAVSLQGLSKKNFGVKITIKKNIPRLPVIEIISTNPIIRKSFSIHGLLRIEKIDTLKLKLCSKILATLPPIKAPI